MVLRVYPHGDVDAEGAFHSSAMDCLMDRPSIRFEQRRQQNSDRVL